MLTCVHIVKALVHLKGLFSWLSVKHLWNWCKTTTNCIWVTFHWKWGGKIYEASNLQDFWQPSNALQCLQSYLEFRIPFWLIWYLHLQNKKLEKKINHFKWGDCYQTAITQPNYFVERRLLRDIIGQRRLLHRRDAITLLMKSDKSWQRIRTNPNHTIRQILTTPKSRQSEIASSVITLSKHTCVLSVPTKESIQHNIQQCLRRKRF